MSRKSSGASKPLLAYSTNVHRGETLADTYAFLSDFTIPIRDRVFPDEFGGLELRLGIGNTRELLQSRARRKFAEFLQSNRLTLFSVNAFPLRDFHAKRVKEQVYQPSWAEAERYRWTNKAATVFADLLPDGVVGSLSTLGGVFRQLGHNPAMFRKLARGYLKTLEKLIEIESRTGKTIVLAVEPEPETTFETSADVIEFFENYLWPAARSAWRAKGHRVGIIEERLRKFFTVNVDTCHFSVLFEDLASNLRKLRRAGLVVGKLHVTNAIRLKNPYRRPAAYHDFRRMDEPRYFHQFCGVDADGAVTWRGFDLNELPRVLKRSRHPDVVELRSHYHVPLYLQRWQRMETTREETRNAVLEVLRHLDTQQLAIETYTWPILREQEKLVDGISAEFRWLLKVVKEFDARSKKPPRTDRK